MVNQKKQKISRPCRDERHAPVVPPIFKSAQTMITARAGVHCNLNTAPGRVPKVPLQRLTPDAASLNEGSLVILPIVAFTFLGY